LLTTKEAVRRVVPVEPGSEQLEV